MRFQSLQTSIVLFPDMPAKVRKKCGMHNVAFRFLLLNIVNSPMVAPLPGTVSPTESEWNGW